MCCRDLIYTASYRSHTPNPCAAGTLYIRLHPGHIHLTRVLREPYIYGFIPVTYTQPVCCRNLIYTASSRSHSPNPCAAGTLYIGLHPGHIHPTRVLREPYIYSFIPVTYTQPVCCGNLIYMASTRSHTPSPSAAGTLYIRLHPGHIHPTRVLREPSIYGFNPVTYTQPVCCGNLLYTASSRSHTPNPCATGTLYKRLHPGHIHLTRVLQEPSIYGFIPVTYT